VIKASQPDFEIFLVIVVLRYGVSYGVIVFLLFWKLYSFLVVIMVLLNYGIFYAGLVLIKDIIFVFELSNCC